MCHELRQGRTKSKMDGDSPPHHTISVTKSWPQLTPPASFSSPSSLLTGVKWVRPAGFFSFFFLRQRNVLRFKDASRADTPCRGPIVAPAWCFLLLLPFCPSVHRLTFPARLRADKNDNLFTVIVSRQLHPARRQVGRNNSLRRRDALGPRL